MASQVARLHEGAGGAMSWQTMDGRIACRLRGTGL